VLVVGNEMESVPDRSYMMLIDLMQLSTQQPLSSNRVFQFCSLKCFRPAFLFIVVIEDRPEEILV
jgi:hypothetical protein